MLIPSFRRLLLNSIITSMASITSGSAQVSNSYITCPRRQDEFEKIIEDIIEALDKFHRCYTIEVHSDHTNCQNCLESILQNTVMSFHSISMKKTNEMFSSFCMIVPILYIDLFFASQFCGRLSYQKRPLGWISLPRQLWPIRRAHKALSGVTSPSWPNVSRRRSFQTVPLHSGRELRRSLCSYCTGIWPHWTNGMWCYIAFMLQRNIHCPF